MHTIYKQYVWAFNGHNYSQAFMCTFRIHLQEQRITVQHLSMHAHTEFSHYARSESIQYRGMHGLGDRRNRCKCWLLSWLHGASHCEEIKFIAARGAQCIFKKPHRQILCPVWVSCERRNSKVFVGLITIPSHISAHRGKSRCWWLHLFPLKVLRYS